MYVAAPVKTLGFKSSETNLKLTLDSTFFFFSHFFVYSNFLFIII